MRHSPWRVWPGARFSRHSNRSSNNNTAAAQGLNSSSFGLGRVLLRVPPGGSGQGHDSDTEDLVWDEEPEGAGDWQSDGEDYFQTPDDPPPANVDYRSAARVYWSSKSDKIVATWAAAEELCDGK